MKITKLFTGIGSFFIAILCYPFIPYISKRIISDDELEDAELIKFTKKKKNNLN